jgi:hypothetical protein
VSSKHGPPKATTRHVLLALALYMSPKGDSCFPSIATLASDTGLSSRSVITHLQEAAALGWVSKRPQPMPAKGKGWKRMAYVATAPKVVKEVHHEELAAGEPVAEGGEPNDRKVVKEVHTMHPVDATRDAASAAAQDHESLEDRTARALASGKLNAWEEKFCRSKMSQLAAGRELKGDQLPKLLEILGGLSGPPAVAVNVPSAATQAKKSAADLVHDEDLLRERVESKGYVPPELVEKCVRVRGRIGEEVPAWLAELAANAPKKKEPKRLKLTARAVEKRLKNIAAQSRDAGDGTAVA